MGTVDTMILFAYLALMVGLGFYAQRRQQGVEDYFVAGRRMGPATIACLWVAAWIGGASNVGTSARVYQLGITGIWYILAIAIGCLLFGLTMARRVKQLGDRHQHLTYPDFIEQHYDNRTRVVATVCTVLAYTAYTAGQFAAAAAMLQVLLGWDYGQALLLSGAIVILYTGWTLADPISSLIVSGLIVRSAWALVRRSTHILMEGTPEGLDVDELRSTLERRIPAIRDVHHVHLWLIGPHEPLMTMHATIVPGANQAIVLRETKAVLQERFGITHATIQIDVEDCADTNCA